MGANGTEELPDPDEVAAVLEDDPDEENLTAPKPRAFLPVRHTVRSA